MLWSPEAHEPLADAGWDETRVRDAIRTIAADTEDGFDDGWPIHAHDAMPDDPERYNGLYLGGAGVVDALRRLADRGLVELRRDYVPYVERLTPDVDGDDGLWFGETGLLLILQRLAPSEENLVRLRELVASNRDDERHELMWGSPGTMLVARELGFDELWQDSADLLRSERDPGSGLWTQHLYGRVDRYVGPAHGFAGCALALGDEPGTGETAARFAVRENDLANWPPRAADGLVSGDGTVRTQWCHGAPGMVASLASQLDRDLALAGAELTWRAGPLAKGANLCHGTAGNGYAFLAVLELTGDELWLERARRFALHALAQVERERRRVGRGRYSLWTGDVGTALYLADCLDGSGALPLP